MSRPTIVDAALRVLAAEGVEASDLVIVGGAVLEAWGVRPASDVDMVLLPGAWGRLAGCRAVDDNYMGGESRHIGFGEGRDKIDVFDRVDTPVNHHGARYIMTAEDLMEHADEIDGVLYQSLADLADMKRGLTRDKDKDDLASVLLLLHRAAP